MFITKIDDLKKTLELKSEYEKKLFHNSVYLYNLSEHCGSVVPNIDINLETAKVLYVNYQADLNTIISTIIYRIVKKFNIPDKEVLRMFNEDIKNKVNLLSNFDDDVYSISSNNRLQMIKSLTKDVKITIIKLVERCVIFNHLKKNKYNDTYANDVYVNDTLDFYVPISKLLGIYIMKNELEDACFKYNNNFDASFIIGKKVTKEYKNIIKLVNTLIESESIGLTSIPTFEINRKSGYDIFRKANEVEKKVKELKKKEYINLLGFCSIRCLLDNKEDCYKIIYLLHKFKPIFGSFSDYIGGPQGNEYHAIHTSVFIEGHVVDFRICTKDMDYINYYGITSSWKDNSNLQERLINNYDFYSELVSLEEKLTDEELIDAFIKNIVEEKNLKVEYLDLNMQKFMLDEKGNVK